MHKKIFLIKGSIRINYMTAFNIQQHAASQPGTGIYLVIAGPGTGKTRTLIERINRTVIEFNVPPENILILTFSRKAADEIHERLTTLSGKDFSAAFTGTFHSFCLRLLRENSRQYLRLSGMEAFPHVLGREQEEIIMKNIFMSAPERFMGMPYDAVLKIMNRRKSFDAKTKKRLAMSGFAERIEEFREEYRSYKLRNFLIDYADMTRHAIELLSFSEELKEAIQTKYSFIFVDEFQDTSDEDFMLLSLLAGNKANMFMVGDANQAIFRFRGANVGYLVNLKRFFPAAAIDRLTVNYRSHNEIVDVSNRFIRHNRVRSKKFIISAKGKGGKVRFHRVPDFTAETEKISQIINASGESLTCAVLYRNNYQGVKLRRITSCGRPGVSFLTMHASKGLEFDCVIISGVKDGIIPDRDTEIEDERRLFYVALTRAKKELHIIYQAGSKDEIPRFIAECGYKGY